MHAYIYICMHIDIYMYMHADIYIHMHVYIYVDKHIYIHVYVSHMYRELYTLSKPQNTQPPSEAWRPKPHALATCGAAGRSGHGG